jgi:hypothetical protein
LLRIQRNCWYSQFFERAIVAEFKENNPKGTLTQGVPPHFCDAARASDIRKAAQAAL